MGIFLLGSNFCAITEGNTDIVLTKDRQVIDQSTKELLIKFGEEILLCG